MKNPQPEKLQLPDADVLLYRNVFSPAESEKYLAALQQQVAWQQDFLKMYGREMAFPRLTAWYGDPEAIYVYSKIENKPLPWLPVLLEIKARAEEIAGTSFNSVLLNYYRDQQDSMGWHSDNEKALGPEPVIASVSFGAARQFQFRHKTRKELPPVKIRLENGSLLLMQGKAQQCWKHQLPKEKMPCGPRVNLTFRKIV